MICLPPPFPDFPLYSMICSPWQLLPRIQSPVKNQSPITGCLSTWQFNLYNKSDSDLSEIQRMRVPKLHSLSFVYISIPRTMCNWRQHGLIWHPSIPDFQVLFFAYTNSHLVALFPSLSKPAASKLYIVVSQAFTQDSRPAMLLGIVLLDLIFKVNNCRIMKTGTKHHWGISTYMYVLLLSLLLVFSLF